MNFYINECPHLTLNYKSPNFYELYFCCVQEKLRKQNEQFKNIILLFTFNL